MQTDDTLCSILYNTGSKSLIQSMPDISQSYGEASAKLVLLHSAEHIKTA